MPSFPVVEGGNEMAKIYHSIENREICIIINSIKEISVYSFVYSETEGVEGKEMLRVPKRQ